MADPPAQFVHRGTRAIERMVEFAPSTGGLALWVRHCDLPADRDAPPVATDGLTVYYGASFETLTLPEQIGLVAHEVLHIALRHPQRFLDLQRLIGDVDLQLFNICADAIVNSTLGHLSWLELPRSAVLLDRLLASALDLEQDVEPALLAWDVERLYRAVDDRRAPDQPSGRAAERARQGGAGASDRQAEERSHIKPAGAPRRPDPREDGPRAACARRMGAEAQSDLLPRPEAQGPPEAEAEQARAWSERILRGHAGDGAFSMLRTLVADLPKTRTPWEQVLRTQLARGLTRRPAVSWSRPSRSYIANQGRGGPNRRLPWEPGFAAAKRAPRLALIVDVSGSIDDDLMDRFASEIEAISRRQEAGLVLIVGDAQVRRVAFFEPGRADLREIECLGGGGTNFTPLLEEADRHRPDIAVVLTDLEGPADFRPRCPVIWAVPEASAHVPAPFGRKLTLD